MSPGFLCISKSGLCPLGLPNGESPCSNSHWFSPGTLLTHEQAGVQVSCTLWNQFVVVFTFQALCIIGFYASARAEYVRLASPSCNPHCLPPGFPLWFAPWHLNAVAVLQLQDFLCPTHPINRSIDFVFLGPAGNYTVDTQTSLKVHA